jgi:molecular chaperone GrpE
MTQNSEQPEQDIESPDELSDDAEQLSPLQQLERERDEFEARYLRAMADYQNLARRAQQNEIVAHEQAIMSFTRRLITVLDHFDHAVEVDPNQTSAADVLKGLTIVHNELLRSLQQFGVERLNVERGEVFDPNRHEALMREANDELETDQIIAQFQPGYTLADKILRPAKVSVAE